MSVSSIVQYVFFAAIVYVLAGAPLASLFGGSSLTSGVNVKNDAGANMKKLDNLVIPEEDLQCGEHTYKGVYVLNREPLVVYVEGFLSDEEAKHIVNQRYVYQIRERTLESQHLTRNFNSQLTLAHPSSNSLQSSTKAKKPSTHPSAIHKKRHHHAMRL